MEVVHEQVRPVVVDDDVDVVAISFFSGFADRAYELADAYRARGVRVVLGGPHASYWPAEALRHADAVVTGEAESVWLEMLRDAERGRLRKTYRGEARPLAGLPSPRHDLLEDRFAVRRVVQATRGCPFSCSFCSVPELNPGFRVRPVDEVLRDVEKPVGPGGRDGNPLQEKLVWFWDDNLLVRRAWAKDLLRGLRGRGRWWLTQASIDIVRDRELMRLMRDSGCIGIFLGIETFTTAALRQASKRQNKVAEYRDAVKRLHDEGICVMAGFIAGFDDQTPADVVHMADVIQALEFDVPFLSVLTPFRGTPLYEQMRADNRLLSGVGWNGYNGYNVAYSPKRMTAEALRAAHRTLWRRAFSPRFVAERLARGARQLRPGALLLAASMNGFYGLKRFCGNVPADARPARAAIEHPKALALLVWRWLQHEV